MPVVYKKRVALDVDISVIGIDVWIPSYFEDHIRNMCACVL